MPSHWTNAPYLGNGMMGTMVLVTGENTVRWEVGRGDAQDHRPLNDNGHKRPTMYARNRLPIGFFELNTVGKITGGTMELDLWNAEARGTIETANGKINWRSIVHSELMVIIWPSPMELDYAQHRRAPRTFLIVSGALVAVVCFAWWVARTWPWAYDVRRDHGDFHVQIWTDAYEIQFNETHHFEQWHVAYWKLLLLSLIPAARYLQLRLRSTGP